MQYIDEDLNALESIFKLCNKKGKIIIYVPINDKILTRIYKYLFYKFNNYEKIQNRKRVYTIMEIEQKISASGFTQISKIFTYGFFGLLSNEIINSLIIIISQFNFLFKVIGILLFIILYPLILLLMILDFCITKNNGNSILIIAEKL